MEKKGTLRDMVSGVFSSSSPPAKKTYAQIVSKFSETRTQLQTLVADSETNIANLDTQIAQLEIEKEREAEEKISAIGTLDFLDKFIKF